MTKHRISHITVLLSSALAACTSFVEDNTGWYDTSEDSGSGTGAETGATDTGGTDTGGTETGAGAVEDDEPDVDAPEQAEQARGVDWSKLQWAAPSKDRPERALRGRPSVVVVEPESP